jgi:peptide/nickel transport system permease protein
LLFIKTAEAIKMLLRYLIKRLFYMAVVFFLISIIIFSLFRAVPGDPVMLFLNPEEARLPAEELAVIHAQISAQLGLDQPIPIQFLRWFGNLVQGNFGYSINHMRPVSQVLGGPIMVTLQMNLIIMAIVFMIAVPLGVTTAIKKGSVYDNTAQTITLFGFSIPSFITAILAVVVFSVWLELTPVSGFGDPLFVLHNPDPTRWEIFVDRIPFLILPVAVISFSSLAGLTRIVRATMIDAMSQDYVRTARAKGVREGAVVMSHAFRNSMIPFVTSLMSWILGLISGAVIIESIFGINGMGRALVTSIMAMDYNMALAILTIFTVIILIGYLVLDFIYVIVDPRVRLD